MPRKVYGADDVDNFVNLTLEELVDKYPDKSKNYLRAIKKYYERKAMETPEHLPNEAKLEQVGDREVSTISGWYEVVTKDNEGVAHTHRLYKHSTKTRPNPQNAAEVFEPAQPAEIRPTRRKRTAKRLGKLLLAFGDSQIGYRRIDDELQPLHNEAVLSIISQINADLRPEEVINLSDTIDLAELSRFDPDSDSFHRTLGPSFQRVHDFYAQLVADNPDAKFTEVDSNHTARVMKAVMKKMPELYGFTLPGEDYPLLSYYRLANLGRLGINFISGYGAAEYVYGEENQIVFKHGVFTSSTPGGTVAKEIRENPEVNVVRAHGHSYESAARTTRSGRQLYYFQIGCSCHTTGEVPSYRSSVDDHGRPVHNQHNWQNQIMIIHDFGDRYQFDVIDIVDGKAYYNNKEYDGNEL